jgi:hypothetical protein
MRANPLHVYEDMDPPLKARLDAVDAQASFFSPLNVIGRLAMGKWDIQFRGEGYWAFVADGVARIIPPADKAEYYQAILAWSEKHTVAFVPTYMADILRQRGLRVLKQQTEYIMDPKKLIGLAGGALRSIRYDRARSEKVATVEKLDPFVSLGEMIDLVRAWYAEAKDRLWRPSERAHIEWLLENWSQVLELEPSALCVGVRDNADGKLLSFEMGSYLSDGYASSFTQRSDRSRTTGVYAGVNMMASIALAGALGRWLNDGPADHKELAARKARLAIGTVDFYTVASK